MSWLASFAAILAVLLLLDWVFPRRIRLFAIGLFRADPDAIEEFYVQYQRGHLGRVGVAILLSLIGAAIVHAGLRFEIQALAVAALIVFYGLVLSFAMWRADLRTRS